MQTCGVGPADESFVEAFGESVCNVCKGQSTEWKLLNRTDLKLEYLLTDSTIRCMKCICKDNPHNPNWSQMRLYLTKHGEAKSMERWGSIENLENEKKRRNKEHFARDLEKADKVLKTFVNDVDDDSEGCLSKLIASMKDDDQVLGLAGSHSRKKNDECDNIGDRSCGGGGTSTGDEKVKKKRGKVSQKNSAKAKKIGLMAAIIRGDNY